MSNTGRSVCLALLSSFVVWGTCCAAEVAAETLPREHHAWGRFSPGAWQKARITSETLDDAGQVIRTTITDTKTTLLSADHQFYTLKVESTVEVLGKRIEAAPQIIKRTYDDLPYDQTAATRIAEQVDVAVDNRQFQCAVLETVAKTAVQTVTARTYYCRLAKPFALRRDVTVMQTGGASPSSESSMYVIAMDMPHKVLGETYSASHIKTVYRQNGSTMITVSVQVLDVPGGTVAHSSKEVNSSGQLIRRSTLELLESGADEQVEVKANADPMLRMGYQPAANDSQYLAPLPELRFRGRGVTRMEHWVNSRRNWGR